MIKLILLWGNLFSFTISLAQQPRLVVPIGIPEVASSATLSPNEKYVLIRGEKFFQIWETETGKLLYNIPAKDWAADAQFSPMICTTFITVSHDKYVREWDTKTTEKLIFALADNPGLSRCAQYKL